MGYRLHVASVNHIEWGNTEEFNYKTYEFHRLLDSLEVEYSGEAFDEEFEVSKEDLQCGINKLISFDSLPLYSQERVKRTIDELESTVNEIIRILQSYQKEADENNEYLRFSFF